MQVPRGLLITSTLCRIHVNSEVSFMANQVKEKHAKGCKERQEQISLGERRNGEERKCPVDGPYVRHCAQSVIRKTVAAHSFALTKTVGPRIVRARRFILNSGNSFLLTMPKASKAAFYAVHRGHKAGVYASWCDKPCDYVVYCHACINII